MSEADDHYLQIRPNLETLFSVDPERKKLQIEVARRLLAYFDTVYQVLEYAHPDATTPIVIWMTQDRINPKNPFQGPIPMMVMTPDQKFIKKWEMYDYRQLNDSRGGVYSRDDDEINPRFIDLLELPTEELAAMCVKIDHRMEMILDPVKRRLIVNSLRWWDEKTGYASNILVTESSSHDYDSALLDLVNNYRQRLSSCHNHTTQTNVGRS